MHSCLITAPTITEYRSHAEVVTEAVRLAAVQPQLGVLRVAAVMEAVGDRPHLVDVNAAWMAFVLRSGGGSKHDFAEELAAEAMRSNADLYGFSSICSTFPLSLRIAEVIKRERPYATILFGGPQASVVDVATMEAFPWVDLILRGEVERTLPQLLGELQGDREFSRVDGLTYRSQAGVERTVAGPVIEDLDGLLPPAYHLSEYLRGSKTASVELGRGCPFACTFCSTNDFFRRRFRLRSPSNVLEEMRSLAARYGTEHFELVHDMFTVDRKRVVAFCETMRASGEAFTWDCSARTDCVDEDLLELMAASGCRGIFFGIETGSRRMQRLIDKDLDPEWAESVLDAAERLGIRTTASLITGFPQEQRDDLQDTLRIFLHAARCGGSQPQLNLLAPLAGTPIHVAHRHELRLETAYSDMSHQGLTQDERDLELIRAYPEIFPNFYLIPTAGLDRDEMLELREFLTMGVVRFRWLLCAVTQAWNVLELHAAWRLERMRRYAGWDVPTLRRYYMGERFAGEFLDFLGTQQVREEPAVAVLLAVEEARARAQRRGAVARQWTRKEGGMGGDDYPELQPTTEVLRTDFRVEEVMRSVAAGGGRMDRQSCWYVTQADERGQMRLAEISAWMASTLAACDGVKAVSTIVRELAEEATELTAEEGVYVFGRMLEGAWDAGYLCVRGEARVRARGDGGQVNMVAIDAVSGEESLRKSIRTPL